MTPQATLTKGILSDFDKARRGSMHVTAGPHNEPVRDPGQTFGLRNVPTPVGFRTEDARAAVRVVNDTNLLIEQLQHQIGKLDHLIAEEEATRGKLSEFVWAILHTISPLPIERGGAVITPSRTALLQEVAAMFGAEEGAVERREAIAELKRGNTVFAALVETFLLRAQHEKAGRHVRFPPILLHACLLISNTSPAAYAHMTEWFGGFLPTARTLRSYNATGDISSGCHPELYRKINDYVVAVGATGSSLHGTLSWDEMSTLDVS